MAKHLFTISTAHVDLQRAGLPGKSAETAKMIVEARKAVEAIGTLQPRDVLKHVYVSNGVIQVENDAQRAARLDNPAGLRKWQYEPQTDTIRAMPMNHCVASLHGADAATDKLRNGEAIARVPDMIQALRSALEFVATIDDHGKQNRAADLIIEMRAALGVECL